MRKIDLTNFRVATSETARDINRRIVLNLIRSHEPISRAELARHSGLQRSTVSVITEQLIQERWVTQGANGRAPRGRRPRFLHLNKERVRIIGINVRPATTTVAVADLDAKFVAQESLPTAKRPEQFVADMIPRLRNLINMRPDITCEGIGISLPGRVDAATQRLVFAPNLGWSDVDLKTPLEKATGLPVELENAANACALAELWLGRQTDGVRDLIAVTVSEGIGTGLILNHQLVRGSSGLAGEFGHITIEEEGLWCGCGNRGCWEAYASNSAAVRYYSGSDLPAGRTKAGVQPSSSEPAFEDLVRLTRQNDSKAIAAVERMAHYLGVGISLLVTGLAPDAIVVIGEVTRVWDRVGPIIDATVKRRCFTHASTRITATDPATKPRLRGTIPLVLQKHFGAPSVA
jgi:predicted NBD/HSP70 family sugar kinase